MKEQNKLICKEKQKVIKLPTHKPPELEREYGNYRVKLCFAEQDVPNAEKYLRATCSATSL